MPPPARAAGPAAHQPRGHDGAGSGLLQHPRGDGGHSFRELSRRLRQPVRDLAFGLFVRQIVQPLQDQDLEHEHHVVPLAARHRLRAPRKHRRQLQTERLEVNIAVLLFQELAQPREQGQALGLIEEHRLI